MLPSSIVYNVGLSWKGHKAAIQNVSLVTCGGFRCFAMYLWTECQKLFPQRLLFKKKVMLEQSWSYFLVTISCCTRWSGHWERIGFMVISSCTDRKPLHPSDPESLNCHRQKAIQPTVSMLVLCEAIPSWLFLSCIDVGLQITLPSCVYLILLWKTRLEYPTGCDFLIITSPRWTCFPLNSH